ncbi:MAG: LemA family protein [Candidatus Gracilibacteria bacterium]|jgi:LemA protein
MAKAVKRSSTGLLVLGGVLALLVIFALWLMGLYNGLVTQEGTVNNTWAQVEVQYQRRSDLVAQLLPTVEATAEFEQETLIAVTEARSAWAQTAGDPNASIEEQMATTQSFDSALSRLLVTVEAYPELTATESFQSFQIELEGSENRVAVARKDYNDATTVYNVKLRVFPTAMFAGMLGFEAYPLFESDEGTEDAPVIEFEIGE